jgi:hypothetical protein
MEKTMIRMTRPATRSAALLFALTLGVAPAVLAQG